jgi:hypothetical protein
VAEIRTVTTLHRNREEIKRAIRNYEKRLDRARADLAHLTAAIAIFEARSGDEFLPAYSDLHRLFRYAEGIKLCSGGARDRPKTTRELAAHIAKPRTLILVTLCSARFCATRSSTSYGGSIGRGV